MRGTGSTVVATLGHHCAVVALPSVLFRQTWRWLQRQGRRSQFPWPNLAHKPANLGLAAFSVRVGCHQLSRQRSLDGAVCELRRPCRRRISRCELRRAHSGLLRVGCHQEADVLLFGILSCRRRASSLVRLALSYESWASALAAATRACSLPWEMTWRWSRHIGEGLVEQVGDGSRVTNAALLRLWLRLLRLRWRRLRWRLEQRMVHHCRVLHPRRKHHEGYGRRRWPPPCHKAVGIK